MSELLYGKELLQSYLSWNKDFENDEILRFSEKVYDMSRLEAM